LTSSFIAILSTVFIVMDPVGLIPQFLSLTADFDEKTRTSIINRAVPISGVVMLIFLLLGRFLLDFFGIKPGAFYISGGILFFIISFEMIYNKPGHRKTPEDQDAKTSIALFPLAVPLIAGPGLLTVIMMHMAGGPDWLGSFLTIFPALLICLGLTYLALRCSSIITRLLSSTGIFVLEKIMGLILSGFAVQFVLNGLIALGLLNGKAV